MLTCTDCNKPSSQTYFQCLRLVTDGAKRILELCPECFSKPKYSSASKQDDPDWERSFDAELSRTAEFELRTK